MVNRSKYKWRDYKKHESHWRFGNTEFVVWKNGKWVVEK